MMSGRESLNQAARAMKGSASRLPVSSSGVRRPQVLVERSLRMPATRLMTMPTRVEMKAMTPTVTWAAPGATTCWTSGRSRMEL